MGVSQEIFDISAIHLVFYRLWHLASMMNLPPSIQEAGQSDVRAGQWLSVQNCTVILPVSTKGQIVLHVPLFPDSRTLVGDH